MKLCAELVQAVTSHPGTATLVAGVLGTAFASTVPEERPKTLDEWWAWFRDIIRQIGNARHPSLPKV
jgi:thioesterase domain-containing protein